MLVPDPPEIGDFPKQSQTCAHSCRPDSAQCAFPIIAAPRPKSGAGAGGGSVRGSARSKMAGLSAYRSYRLRSVPLRPTCKRLWLFLKH